jgi:hypothetical protein
LMTEVGLHRRRRRRWRRPSSGGCPCLGVMPDVRLYLLRLRPLAHRRRLRKRRGLFMYCLHAGLIIVIL